MTIVRKKKTNYLSNKNLLKDIHESKCSYCQFKDEKYKHYDLILDSPSELTYNLTPALLKKAKEARIEYIIEQTAAVLVDSGISDKEAYKIASAKAPKIRSLSRKDIVIRVMTNEHIPPEILGNKKNLLHTLQFHPFKHYTFSRGKWTEVGRSHWDGNFKTGHFIENKGKMTDRLVLSLIMLVDRFSNKSNYRNYSYIMDMKGQALVQLSQVALQFNESRSDNPFSFYTQCTYTSFCKILKEEKRNREIRDQLLVDSGMNASSTYQSDHTGDDSFGSISDDFYKN